MLRLAIALMFLACLAWAQDDQQQPPQPHTQRPVVQHKATPEEDLPNSEVEPEICKQVDNKDHRLMTQEERLLQADCEPVHDSGRLVWVNPKYIEEDIARNKAQAYAQTHGQDKVVHLTPIVTDKDGNVLDEAAQKKLDMDHWNELHASGQCTKVAQDLVKHNDEYHRACTPAHHSGRCMQYGKEIGTVAFCAVSPDDPELGYKVRAIKDDFMATAITMAQSNQ
jgi:hypothetical protein